jgi:hypothetical protein
VISGCKKMGGPLASHFCCFFGVSRGGCSKSGVLRVVFCGENMVECVVKGGALDVTF